MFRPSVRILLGSYRFVPDLLCLLLTSAWTSRHLSMSVALWHPCRSPRVLRTHLHAYACRIYAASFCASTGLCRNSPAHPNASPHIRFLFVRPALCLGLPSDSQSPTTPLPSANTSPCRVCRGLSPPSKCALPGAQVKGRRAFAASRLSAGLALSKDFIHYREEGKSSRGLSMLAN